VRSSVYSLIFARSLVLVGVVSMQTVWQGAGKSILVIPEEMILVLSDLDGATAILQNPISLVPNTQRVSSESPQRAFPSFWFAQR